MSTEGIDTNGGIHASNGGNELPPPEENFRPLDRSRSTSRSPNRRGNRSRSTSRPRGAGGRRGGNKKRDRSRSGSRGRGNSRNDRHRMMYISNIPYEVRWMELKDLIREKAGDVSFVEMIEKDGKSKGCAVVEFKTRDGAVKCMETMHRLEMGDRRLVVKEIREPESFFRRVRDETGVDFLATKGGGGGPRGKGSSSSSAMVAPFGHETFGLSPVFLSQLGVEGPLCNRVFVANLPYNISTSKLKEVFSLAGQVTDVDLQLDKEGKNKGLAVIEYFHPIEAVQAISMLHSQRFFDRAMTVKMDRFDKPVEPRRPGELPQGLHSLGMGLGANGTPLTNIGQLVASGNFGPTTPFMSPTANQLTNRSMMSSSSGVGASVAPFLSSSRLIPPQLFSNDYSSSYHHQREASPPPRDSRMMIASSLYGSSAAAPSLGNVSPFLSRGSGGGAVGASSMADFEFFRERERDREHGGVGGGGGYQQKQQQPAAAHYYESSDLPAAAPQSQYGYGSGSGGIGGGGSYDGPVGATTRSSLGGVDFDRYDRSHGGGIRRSPSPPPSGNRSGRGALRAILIRNLPLDYSWQTLRDRLRGFGEVEFADIIQPGAGKIRFKTAADAEKASASLHGMLVEGRAITVDLVSPD